MITVSYEFEMIFQDNMSHIDKPLKILYKGKCTKDEDNPYDEGFLNESHSRSHKEGRGEYDGQVS